MKLFLRKIVLQIAVFQLALLPCQTGWAAVGFTVTPSAVSNGYSGPITLQVTGLTDGATVTIQKYLDANTNGIIDAGDILWQQFNLTDGSNFVIGGVTNINVPGDTDGTANGQITAQINIRDDFTQSFVGQYLFKLTSPTNAITNSFKITNFPYAQKFTGTVLSNGVAVPDASVTLFQDSGGNNLNPVGGAVADNSGNFTIKATPGTYSLAAFKSNFVADTTAAANLVLGASATINTNLSLIAATQTISGSFIDTNTSVGLPGITVAMESADNLLAICFTGSNGNFSLPVTANQWTFEGSTAALAFHGHVGLHNKVQEDTTSGSVSNVTIALPEATALFYGTVLDGSGNPLPGVVEIEADDENNIVYKAEGYTDTNGYYVAGALGSLANDDASQVQVDNTSSYPAYVFSQPDFDQNGGTNMSIGQAVPADFTATLAPYTISGTLTDGNGSPLADIGIYADNTTNGDNQNVDTDDDGNYSITVANGSWTVGVNTGEGNHSLSATSYLAPTNQNQTVVISNTNITQLDFIAIPASNTISGTLTDGNGAPIANVGIYAYTSNYSQNVDTSNDGSYSLGVINGTWTVGVNTCSDCGGGSLPGGYLTPTNQNQSVVISGNSPTVDFVAVPATNTISGNVQYHGSNVIGVGVSANLVSDNNVQAYVDTDNNGNYSLNVTSGTWSVSLNCQGGNNDSLNNILGNGNYACPMQTNVTIANGNVSNVNFNVQSQASTTTTLSGQVVDDGGNPVTNMNVFAVPNGSNTYQATTDSGGNFQMGIDGGNYTLQLDNNTNSGFPARGLVGPAVPINVTDGDDISGFVLVAPRVTGEIQVQVNGSGNAGLSGIGVSATLSIGDTNYETYGQEIPTGNSGAANLPAFNGMWQVNLDCNNVQNQGYLCPSSQNVTISSNTQPATFNLSGSVAQIQVSIDDNPIADGQTNAVNFGSIQQSQPELFETFTVMNTGSATLDIAGVAVPSGYTLTLPPSSTINVGNQSSFTVQLTSTAVNTYTGNISITNNAPGSSPFTFAITGAVTAPPPHIGVHLNGIIIINNGQTNAVNFGFVQQGSTAPVITFTVTNSGGQTLTLSNIIVPAGYTVAANPPGSIVAGSQGEFSVRLNTITADTYSGNISITNNDPNNNPFAFPVTGMVISGPTETLALSASPTNGGGVVGGGTFPQGSVQTVTATPNNSYKFLAWTGNATGTNNPLMVTLNTSLNITANFATNTTNITLSIITNGYGTVSSNWIGTNLKKGVSYKLTATADSENLFSNWTGSITSTNSTLTFKASNSLALQANFVTNPFLPFVGTYNGLFSPTNGVTEETAGMLQGLSVGAKGAYSGKLLINGASKSIMGSFNLAGRASEPIAVGSPEGNVELAMTLTSNYPAPQVTGTVSGTNGGPWMAILSADRATNILSSAEYTILLLPDTTNAPPTNSPGGDGYALITNFQGTARSPATANIAGALADGTAFNQTVPVSYDGYVPIYASLYTKKGLLLGWINLATNTADVGLTWIHPKTSSGLYTNGFTNILFTNQIQLSQWVTNLATNLDLLTNLSLLATSDDTNNPLANFSITVSNDLKLHEFTLDEVSGPTNLSGSINWKTGLLTVTIGSGTHKTNGYGAIVLGGTNGGGYFVTKTNAQAIQLGPQSGASLPPD